MPVETRAKNSATHPGVVAAPRPCRSSAEVALEKKTKADKKASDAAVITGGQTRITELEAELLAEQLKQQLTGAAPSMSTCEKVARQPKPKASKKSLTLDSVSEEGHSTIGIDSGPLVGQT